MIEGHFLAIEQCGDYWDLNMVLLLNGIIKFLYMYNYASI